MVTLFPVPPGTLRQGANEVRVFPTGRPDDVLVGDIRLIPFPVAEFLHQATVDISVVEKSVGTVPSRITIVEKGGTLAPVGAATDERLAVRTGVIYTRDGKAQFGLPAGEYLIFASRGFEYSVDSVEVKLEPGQRFKKRLRIKREVSVPGYISCDTHVHTRELSGHGDATVQERLTTIAGEGLQLAVATEHNRNAGYDASLWDYSLGRHFTVAPGNEVTTRLGHFNVFPVALDASAPAIDISRWFDLFRNITATPGVRAIILNHARDLHLGYRPFGPENHIAVTGENRQGWRLEANAMEVINSGAIQSDPMRLYHDWFGLLNRGLSVASVGSSDTHTVDFVPIAQARTYIEVPNSDPGAISIPLAAQNLTEGRTMVSYGLLTSIEVDGHGSGHTVSLKRKAKSLRVSIRIMGPSWSTVDHIALYANGVKVREASIPHNSKSAAGGVKWSETWVLPRPEHDVYLVAIASGPGVRQPFWEERKPYQPTSKEWTPRVIGSSGVIRVDADGDGRFSSAYDYASRIIEQNSSDIAALVAALAPFDEMVAAQAASILRARGVGMADERLQAALRVSPEATRRGFEAFWREWEAGLGPEKPAED